MFVIKTLAAAVIISFVSWLSGKKIGLAGFLTALPLISILSLAFSQLEWQDPKLSTEYAKSIFAAIPISLLFFVPFLFAEKLNLNFWILFCFGLLLLVIGYFLHLALIK